MRQTSTPRITTPTSGAHPPPVGTHAPPPFLPGRAAGTPDGDDVLSTIGFSRPAPAVEHGRDELHRVVRPRQPGSRSLRPPVVAAAHAGRRRSSQDRRAAASASGSPAGTSSPARPSPASPSASGTPPTLVASTGSPRASASVTTMPYVSTSEGSTRRSAAAYASLERPRQRAGPRGAPGRRAPTPRADRRSLSTTWPGSSVSAPARTHHHGRSRDEGERRHEVGVPLGAGHRRDAQQLAATRRAGRRPAPRRRPGRATCTTAGRQAVRVEQHVSRPATRRDDGRRRGEHPPLPRGRCGIGRPERQVHEHDEPQPVRLGHEDLVGSRRRRDRRRAARRPRGTAGHDGGQTRRAPPRPVAATLPATGVLVHRPARGPQPVEHPAGRRCCPHSAGRGRRCPSGTTAWTSLRGRTRSSPTRRATRAASRRARSPGRRRRRGRRRAPGRRRARRPCGPAPRSRC